MEVFVATEPPNPRRSEEGDEGETPEERARRLADNSSLGTEGARSLSDRVSDEAVAEVLRRAQSKTPEEVEEIVRRANESVQEEAQRRARELLEKASGGAVSDEEVEKLVRGAAELWHEANGEEDYDKTWEGADANEILEGLEDDVLLDSIAEGVRGDLGPDQLTELLSGLRDEPDAGGLYTPHLDAVERGEDVLNQPVPKPTPERTQAPMSISDGAAQLRSVAEDDSVSGAAQDAGQRLANVGVNTEGLDSAVAALQAAASGAAANTAAAVGAAGEGDEAQQLNGVGAQMTEALSTAMQMADLARQKATEFAQAVQQAQTAADEALAVSERFRATCADIAGRHGA